MAIQIQVRRDTETNWSLNNPVLAVGEIGFVTDTYQVKIGDGVTLWNSLDYFSDIDSASASLVSYVNERVEDLIGLSPETLDTLEELATALGDDPDFFNTISASVTSASAFALSEANSYTDGEITSLESVLASASAQAVLDANSYTDGEVATAIVTASAAAVNYVDSELLNYSAILININQVSGSASYTLQSSDTNSIVEMNSSIENTITVPANSTISFEVGTSIDVVQTGIGQTIISPASTVTINSKEGNNKISAQYGAATLYKRGTNEWILIGDLEG